MGHAQGRDHVGLSQADHGNIDGAAQLDQGGLLEVAEHEGVVSFLLGLEGVADHLTGAAELAQRMEGEVRRIEAEDLEADARARDRIEHGLQAIDVRRLLDRMNEALVPDPGRAAGRLCLPSVCLLSGAEPSSWAPSDNSLVAQQDVP